MHVPVLEHSVAWADRKPPTWMLSAACRGRMELFFPARYESAGARERREAVARELCLSCPVLDSCRRWAREHREYGFWGAESEEERAAAGYCVALPIGRVARAGRRQRNDAASSGDLIAPRWREAAAASLGDDLEALAVMTGRAMAAAGGNDPGPCAPTR